MWPSRFKIDQGVGRAALAAQSFLRMLENLKAHLGTSQLERFDPGSYDKGVSKPKGSFVMNVKFLHIPSQAFLEKGLHGKSIAALHLIKARRKDIILIATGMDMLKKIQIIRAHLHVGGEHTPRGLGCI